MATQLSATKLNGIDTEMLKETMDQVSRDPASGIARFGVTTTWKGGTQSETAVDSWELGGRKMDKQFTIRIDEPAELLGTNTAPNPQETLLAATNACMMATYVAACAMQGIELQSLEIESTGALDLRGFLGLGRNVKPGYDEIEYTVRIKGNGTAEQFERVHQWVMKTSPNYWNMANPIQMKPRLVVES
jgi:uncharacterized OsmC-like protein